MRRREFIALVGGAAVWPVAARAQQSDRMRRIGLLMSTVQTDPEETSSVAAFVQALGRAGWIPGRNVTIDYRWGAGEPSHFQKHAQELVGLAPDVIFAKGACIPAIAQTTSTIPIVFAAFSDFLAETYVGSFAQPRGNITGFTTNETTLVGKRLEILKEISPRTTRVLLIRGARPETRTQFLLAAQFSPSLGIAATDCPAENDGDIESAIASFVREPDGGITIAFDAFNIVHRGKITELAERYRLPAVYFNRSFAVSGGLVSYGFDQARQFADAAGYVDRILKGEKPSDLPVQAPTKFELVINLKTAKALGLTISRDFLLLADEVIE
jgi:putative tryptophan/tyrosine transport system substrate-binding protein